LHNEPNKSQIREIDVKLEGFVENWVIPWIKKKEKDKPKKEV